VAVKSLVEEGSEFKPATSAKVNDKKDKVTFSDKLQPGIYKVKFTLEIGNRKGILVGHDIRSVDELKVDSLGYLVDSQKQFTKTPNEVKYGQKVPQALEATDDNYLHFSLNPEMVNHKEMRVGHVSIRLKRKGTEDL